MPIAEEYELEAPFLGAILAGKFTAPSLEQLRSLRFNIVYIPYESIVTAFASVGIDARFDEKTPDPEFSKCVDLVERLSAADRTKVKSAVLKSNKRQFDEFFAKLRRTLDRTTERVTILPLFGPAPNIGKVTEAVTFIEGFEPANAPVEFLKYEVSVVFSNADEVRRTFDDKEEAVRVIRYVTS